MNSPNQLFDAALVGYSHVKASELKGFNRKLHTIPRSFDDRTNQFIAKISDDDVAVDIERMFQKIRSTFGLKRKEIMVSKVEPGCGTIQTPDFFYSIRAVLDAQDPAWLQWERSVRNFQDPSVVGTPQFAAVFDNIFDRIEFQFDSSFDLSAWIDKLEDQPNRQLSLDYDSALTQCTLRIEGILAQIAVTNSGCSVIHPNTAPTHQIFNSYMEARDAIAFGDAAL